MKFKARKEGVTVRLASTIGGHIVLVGSEFVEVPEHMEGDAYASGCISEELYNSIKADINKEGKGKSVADSLGEDPDRQAIVADKIREMLDSSEEGNFTSAGLPNVNKLAKACGFRVNSDEMMAAWGVVSEEIKGD